jgi:F0F1-type ATP synthase delta subunit
MSEIVKCGICGKAFNKRYVNSHKRLAHKNEREVMEEILHLYETLSDEKRKELQIRLKSPASAR